MAWEAGTRIAWSHQLYVYAPGAVIYEESLPAGAQLGSVVAAADDTGSLWQVQLDDEQEPRVLTADELVEVHVSDAPDPTEG